MIRFWDELARRKPAEAVKREARLILPRTAVKSGASLAWNLTHVEAKLVSAFGGFTRVDGQGGWRNNAGVVVHEPVAVYDVAAPDTPESAATLQNIARGACIAMFQDCIYTRGFDGNVKLVTVPEPPSISVRV